MRLTGLILLVFLGSAGMAQHLPLYQGLGHRYLKVIHQQDTALHTTFKPLMASEMPLPDSLQNLVFGWNRQQSVDKSWFMRKLRHEPFVHINKPEVEARINPLLNINSRRSLLSDSAFFVNTRGVELKGRLGKKLFFYTSFRENQAYYPGYINNYVNRHGVAPGQGVRKIFGDDERGHDFAQVAGYLDFRPFDFMRIRLGHHKHFVGSGYRSLLLSDNTSNYPFAGFHLRWKNWRYRLVFAELQDFRGKYYNYHYRKLASFYYLSYMPAEWLEAGLFQGVKWNTGDRNTSRDVPAMYFSPVLFSQLAAYGWNGTHNVLTGLQLKAKVTPWMQLYAQGMVDEFGKRPFSEPKAFYNQTGFQVGLQYFDVLHGLGQWQQLYARLEFNHIRPYAYAHQEPFMAYTQLNQPLAHPKGAGLQELVSHLHYRFRDISLSLRYHYTHTSKDTAEIHTGSDIFKPDALAYTNPAATTAIGRQGGGNVHYLKASLNYLINPAYNFHIFAAVVVRKAMFYRETSHARLFQFGLRTALNNFYFDL